MQVTPDAELETRGSPSMAIQSTQALTEKLQQHPELLRDRGFTTLRLSYFAAHGIGDAAEELLQQLVNSCPKDELRILVNTKSETGETLLMLSAAQGLGSIVQLLLDLGADPSLTVGPAQWTALDFAADAGYFSIAQQLVAGGADASQAHVFAKILSNEREYAGENTGVGPGKQVTPGPASKTNPSTLTPLGRAVFEGDMPSVVRLLGSESSGPSRCDIEGGAAVGCAPFLLASVQSHFEMMDLLLSHGANINTTSKHGWTPLMLATQRGDERCLKWLVARGADVNHLSPDRWAALSEATNSGFTQIMALLLEAGADPEVRAQSDWAPLMYAAYRGDIEAVNMLLEAGASFEEISAHDETVMLLAAAAGSATVVRRLLDAGCPPDSVWSRIADPLAGQEAQGSADSEGSTATPKLQERIERAYRVGWTPLMVACQVGNLEIVTILAEAGPIQSPRVPCSDGAGNCKGEWQVGRG